jgi:hypothetical protein
VKTFNYRGSPRLFSNRYYFDDLAPADNTKWTTFADAVTAAEKAIFQPVSTQFKIVEAVGYDAGSDVPVFSKAYNLTVTGSFASAVDQAGDVVALVRYSTSARTSKNHPIYLYNYYHGAKGSTLLTIDELNAAQKTAIGTYAAAWVAGFSDGAVTHNRCGPQGHTATGYLVNSYLRHRDFPAG